MYELLCLSFSEEFLFDRVPSFGMVFNPCPTRQGSPLMGPKSHTGRPRRRKAENSDDLAETSTRSKGEDHENRA